MGLWALRVVVCACMCSAVGAVAAPPEDTPGPPAGARIPAFSASDQNGKTQSLSSLRGSRGVFLFFVASVDWSPFCKAQMLDAQQELDRLRELGWGVAAVTSDSPEVVRHFSERGQIEYPVLADPESRIIRAFGLEDPSLLPGSPYSGAARPVVLLVNTGGIVTATYSRRDFKQRYTVAHILARQFHILPEAGEVQALATGARLATGRSASWVRAGQTIGLSVELRTPSGTRPEALEWTIAGSPALEVDEDIERAEGDGPESRLFREITVAQDPVVLPRLVARGRRYRCSACGGISGTLRIEGSLKYRICEKQSCAEPQTVPLMWKVRFEPYDSERVPWELQKRAAR